MTSLIKASVKIGESELQLENLESRHATALIKNFFKTMEIVGTGSLNVICAEKEVRKVVEQISGHKDTISSIEENKKKKSYGFPKTKQSDTTATFNNNEVAATYENETKEAQNSIKRQLPLLNSERNMSVSLSEKLINFTTQEDYERGYKEFEDGQTKYLCGYTCDCGKNGTRWVKKTTKQVFCHSCQAKIMVEPATLFDGKDGLPERDADGNFYIAREMYDPAIHGLIGSARNFFDNEEVEQN